MEIRNLFDPKKDIYRTIEKVITYGASKEERLKAEISEYVVTESIDDQLEKLLSRMQAAMEAGGQQEIGVWVSGFYGSGKSSFTKYVGLALDERVTVDGQPFLKHLQDRLRKPQTRALLGTVARRFPAAVVMLDLASEQIAGATLEVVSNVLYYKVLQWAGYSRNLKVAAFERKLKKDGRFQEFLQIFNDTSGEPWVDYQNDQLVVDSLLPSLAHRMYPNLFSTEQSFTTATSEIIYKLDDRVKEMLEIVHETSGRDNVLFVIDEVGHYISSNNSKILDLQGFAQNLKNIGGGKAWIVSTAQQTLTEDDPRAALNSPDLYKLKDRFPIQVDLESRDIKEICYSRLLGKSTDGDQVLGQLFDRQGQALRHNTRLQGAKYYDADFSRKTFSDLYPFLPAHFDILLHLLGALAKSTGGIGLRSAIKVIQDILVEGADEQTPVANQPVGWLATTVTLYDSLEKDIRRAFPSIHQAVGKTLIRFPDAQLHQEIAKTVAVLQILGNLPVTVENVASLMHPAVHAPSRKEAVKTAVGELLKDSLVPLGEKDHSLHFYSEKLNDIEQERAQIALRTPDMRRIFNDALRDVFSPLPSARLHGTLAVTSGLKAQSGAQQVSLAGEREAIQSVVEFVDPSDYNTHRTRLLDESRHRTAESTIYLLGRNSAQADDLVREIYRSQRIVELHRNDPDQEVRDYCASQSERAGRLLVEELQPQLRGGLAQGSFLFRGQTTAVHTVDQDLMGACKKHLAEVAKQVFDRYTEAPERAETALAEKFLRTGNLAAMTSQLDPLSLVQITAGSASIRSDYKALVSIRDYIDRNGTVEGKRLAEQFGGPPFGWSQDTLRYLIAALLVSGEIKLKVSGREVTVNGQQAIDALKTNNSFRSVGVALRHDKPSNELLARAAERMTDLIGDMVVPLEAEISRAAAKHLPKFSSQFAPLAERLDRLHLPGGDRVRTAIGQIDDLLFNDASDAPQRLGAEESALYAGLRWARSARQALDHGLSGTIATLRRHQQTIRGLPKSGVPGALRDDVEDALAQLDATLRREDFFEHAADLATALTSLQGRVAKAVADMADAQKQRIRQAEKDFKRIPEWNELTQEEQNTALARLDDLLLAVEADLSGLEQLITHEFDIQTNVADVKQRIEQDGRRRRHQRIEEQKRHVTGTDADKRKYTRSMSLPERVSTTGQLDGLVRELQTVQADVAFYDEFELTFTR